MSSYEHTRTRIFSAVQHIYRHSLEELAYAHQSAPFLNNAKDAIDYVFNVLYPRNKPNVATPADLPTGVDTPNVGDLPPELGDYRVVNDDGDGKNAGYLWAQYDGEASPSWHKVADFDWGINSVISGLLDQTQFLYVRKYGQTDYDPITELPLTGKDGGQRIYGGDLANQHLTLFANNGDPVGNTGFVQFADNVRPYDDLTFNLGTATERFLNGYFGTLVVGTATMTITSNGVVGSITDTSGEISFDDDNIRTTGNAYGTNIIASNNLIVDDSVDTLTLSTNSILSSTGAIDFASQDLSTTGNLLAGQTTIESDIVISANSIISLTDLISFGTNDVTTTGDLFATTGVLDRLEVDDVVIDGNEISTASGASVPQTFESYNLVTWPTFNASPRTAGGSIANQRLAVRFVPIASAPFTTFSIYALPRTDGFVTITTGDMVAELYGGDTNGPIGLIATSTNAISSAIWGTENFGTTSEKVFSFANIPLTSGTNYWVAVKVINSLEASSSHIMALGTTTGAPLLYTNKQSTNGGVSWSNTIGSSPIYYKWTYEAAISANLEINPSGVVDIKKALFAFDTTLTGVLSVTGSAIVDQLTFDGRTINSDNGQITVDSLLPDTDNFHILGNSSFHWRDIYFKGSILNTATNDDMSSAELFALSKNKYRDVNETQPAQANDVLFYDSVSGKWLAKDPEPQLEHSQLAGLTTGDAGHTQFVMLNGRAGGQIVSGGTLAGQTLNLKANALLGSSIVIGESLIKASVDNVYDVGSAVERFKDLYLAGQMYGARVENTIVGGLTNLYQAGQIGRIAYATDSEFIYVNTGTQFKKVGHNSYNALHTGVALAGGVNVSSLIDDARNCIWQVVDTTNSEEVLGVTIQKTITTVTVVQDIPLPAGNYRLLGIEL